MALFSHQISIIFFPIFGENLPVFCPWQLADRALKLENHWCVWGVWVHVWAWIIRIFIYTRHFVFGQRKEHSFSLSYSVLDNMSVYSCNSTILIQLKSEVGWHSFGFRLNLILMFLLNERTLFKF